MLLLNYCVQRMFAYKVIGDEDCLNDFNNNHTVSDINKVDWSGLYFQLSIEHTFGTIPYRWETKNGKTYKKAKLLRIEFFDLDIVKYTNNLSHSNIPGDQKAQVIKNEFNISENKCLVDELGFLNKCLLIEEIKNEYELVISHKLLSKLKYSEKTLCTFNCHSKYPIIKSWIDCENVF